MFPQKFHYEGARFMPLPELPSCSGHSASDAARENNPIYRWSGASAADASRFGAIDCCCGAVHQIDYSAPPTLAHNVRLECAVKSARSKMFLS
jgi:hypothetical protein